MVQNKMTVALPLDTTQWDFTPDTFPGFLLANDLVDGIIAQEYSRPGTLPVPLPAGLPYILQSSTENQFLPLPNSSDSCKPPYRIRTSEHRTILHAWPYRIMENRDECRGEEVGG